MTSAENAQARSEADEWKYAEKALTWYGWGSPVGLGLFLVALAATAALIRYAVW
jgi:hypothetical protein